ncbi:MAG TPA: ATP-binding protein [Candidatus Deferrimicrobiaceae bacterium]
MGNEILEILKEFGAGGGDPGNNSVRFLLAGFFWMVLAVVSSQQYKRTNESRDLYIGIAAAFGLTRELLMFVLEYGAFRGFVPTLFSYRTFPPLEHMLTDIGRILLGFAFLRYFAPEKHFGRWFLRAGIAVFVALYLVSAPLWIRFLDAHPGLYIGTGVDYALFWGDMASRITASAFMAAVLAMLVRHRRAGSRVPAALFAGFAFLFLDEFLMGVNITIGLEAWKGVLSPIRHNLGIWAIPLFLATYWGDLFRQLRTEKLRAEENLAERNHAELKLRESEARYRTLVDHIDLGITLVDTNYRVVMANAAEGRLFHCPPADLEGKFCHVEFERRDRPCDHCPGTEAMATREAVTREIDNTRPDGSPFNVRIHAFPVLGEDGTCRGFIELVEDITEVRQAQIQSRKMEAKLLQTQKLESLGILAGGIAHDFNNLLVSMLGNVDLAMNAVSAESPVRPYLQRIDAAATRAADLTNQMLAYSGKGRFVVEPINLSRLVEEMGHLLTTVISKRAHLKFNLAAPLPHVEADATQLRQVVMNLITNASDALDDSNGVITVTTGTIDVDRSYLAGNYLDEQLAPGGYAFVEVSDTGCGMDRETQARIFDPFFTTKHTGRGLGLAAALGIVRSHKGGLRVYSEPGRGTTFKVLFPAIDGDGVAGSAGTERIAQAKPAQPRPAGTVLVADDEEAVRDVARMMLEGAGFTVLTAADGIDAVELFRKRQGDIAAVVLDMTMPRMGGEDAFRELRRIDPGVRVVLSSGYNEQETVNHFLGKGLAGFIQKPYRTKMLTEKVQEAIARTPPPDQMP